MRATSSILACVLALSCGGDDGAGGGTGGADDGGTTAGDASGSGAADDGVDEGSGAASGEGTGSVDDTSGPFTGECDANVSLALAENVGLDAMSVDAIRREFEGSDQPLYLVQVHGSETGASRLDITFGGQPVAGTTYEASGAVGGVFDTPLANLIPNTLEGEAFVSGTVTYEQVGMLEGELLVLQLDLQFEAGTITGCIAQPITVEFSAPPGGG